MRDSELPTRRHPIDWAVISLFAVGAGLRIFQYLLRSSLWGDELAIVANVTSKGPVDLVTHPLGSYQMAPAGFLLCLKAMTAIAGASEYSLRFIAFAFSLLAIFLFARFGREWLSRPAALLALGAFACSPSLILHAAEVKPYSSDVAFSLLCLLAACSWMTGESTRGAVRLAVAGAIAMWFSYPIMLVLASIGLVALIRCGVKFSSNRIRQTSLILGTWLASAGMLTLFEFHRQSKETHTYMLVFWTNWLMPETGNLHTVSSYVVRLFRDCFSDLLHLPFWWASLLLFVIGAVCLLRRSQTAWLVLLPFLAALAASMVRVYPFSGRLILFLVPNLYVLVAAGVEVTVSFTLDLCSPAKWRALLFSGAVVAAAIIMCVWPLRRAHPPFHNSETRPLISYLAGHLRTGDAIYVHNMAWDQYQYYGPEFGLRADEATETSLSMKSMKLGPEPQVVLEDLDQFRGRPRLWVLFGGGYPVEETCAKEYLDSIGTELDHRSAYKASLYLYDLRDRGRPTATGADDFFDRFQSSPACSFDRVNAIGPQQ